MLPYAHVLILCNLVITNLHVQRSSDLAGPVAHEDMGTEIENALKR